MTSIKVGDLNTEQETVSATIIENSPIQYNPEDPYDTPEERAEGMFIGTFIGKFTKDPTGFCSTYREWHIFCRGFYSGFNTKLRDKFTSCPSMWDDEIQYYEGGQELGYVARNALIFMFAGSAGTELVLNADTILNIISNIL